MRRYDKYLSSHSTSVTRRSQAVRSLCRGRAAGGAGRSAGSRPAPTVGPGALALVYGIFGFRSYLHHEVLRKEIALDRDDWRWLLVRTLDGDGKADIVWRHTGGALYIWQMDGTGIETSSYLPPISLDWTIQQFGDFDGDGKADLLWRETTGATYMWLMDGAVASGVGYTAGQADNTWVIQAP